MKRRFRPVSHSRHFVGLFRQSKLSIMLSLTPIMILIVLEFWIDIWTISYEPIHQRIIFKDICLDLAPKIEEYRTAEGRPPENLEQFGLVLDYDLGRLQGYFHPNDELRDMIEYRTYLDGTFTLYNSMAGLRYVSMTKAAWFIIYDKHSDTKVVDTVWDLQK